MNTIDSYQFGEIVINGKKYSSDVIIFSDKVIDNWWRKTGHELCPEDIAEISKEKPEVLIVGCGASGMMKVLPELEKMTKNQGIELIVETTDKACDTYNRLSHSQRLVAALHLTC
jgi:hypothetical protein